MPLPIAARLATLVVGVSFAVIYVGVASFLLLVFRMPVDGWAKSAASGLAVSLCLFLTSTMVWLHKNKKLESERWWDTVRASRPQAGPHLSAWRWARLSAFSWLLMMLCLVGFALFAVNGASQ